MRDSPKPGAVLFVSDVAGMLRFYRDVAEMAVVFEADDHATLEVGGFQLVIHAIPAEYAVPPVAGGSPPLREDAYVKLCLPVASLTTARQMAAQCGGFLQGAEREWEARGFRACDGGDPEGNVIQLREPAE